MCLKKDHPNIFSNIATQNQNIYSKNLLTNTNIRSIIANSETQLNTKDLSSNGAGTPSDRSSTYTQIQMPKWLRI